MDAKARQRLAITHRILDATRFQVFRSQTLATRSGDHVIMAALPDDSMAIFFDQLRQSDGPLHIATLQGDDLIVFALLQHKPAKHASPQMDPEDQLELYPHTPVSMVIEYLFLNKKPIIIREVCPRLCVELVEGPVAHESTHERRPIGPRRHARIR